MSSRTGPPSGPSGLRATATVGGRWATRSSPATGTATGWTPGRVPGRHLVLSATASPGRGPQLHLRPGGRCGGLRRLERDRGRRHRRGAGAVVPAQPRPGRGSSPSSATSGRAGRRRLGRQGGDGIGRVRDGRWKLRSTPAPGRCSGASPTAGPATSSRPGDRDGDGADEPGVVRGATWFQPATWWPGAAAGRAVWRRRRDRWPLGRPGRGQARPVPRPALGLPPPQPDAPERPPPDLRPSAPTRPVSPAG